MAAGVAQEVADVGGPRREIPWASVSPAGMTFLSPGSPTDRRRRPAGT